MNKFAVELVTEGWQKDTNKTVVGTTKWVLVRTKVMADDFKTTWAGWVKLSNEDKKLCEELRRQQKEYDLLRHLVVYQNETDKDKDNEAEWSALKPKDLYPHRMQSLDECAFAVAK